MKEDDIRPDDLMDELARLYDEDLKEFLKQKDNFVDVLCPACESMNFVFKFEKKGFKFVECKECETVYINPRPTLEMLISFYANSKNMKYWNEKIYPASEENRKLNIMMPRAEKIIELCKKYSSDFSYLVDVGAGYGTFCDVINSKNVFKRVVAVEPSAYMAKTCKGKGFEVIEKPIEEVDDIGEVSVITSFESIEHLFKPIDFLNGCNKTLISGGLFIVTTPNIKGFELMQQGVLSSNIGGPDHLNYFHPHSLSLLLNNSGFEVLEILTPGKLDAEIVRKKIICGELDISNNKFLKQVLIDRWNEAGESFQKFLADNNLSSHMWIVARKTI